MKFKVGDKVKILDGSMISFYAGGWTSSMREYIGKVATIKSVEEFFNGRTGYHMEEFDFVYDERGLELAEKTQPIVIYRKDREVIALDKNTGKTGIARCCPDDEFDFQTGAKLAFERLIGPQVKEVKRYAKPGEYIKIVNPHGCSIEEYKKGDILKVVKYGGERPTPDATYYKDAPFKYANADEYVVLEGYQPPKQKDRPFKVGDIVRGKVGSGEMYSITNEDMTKAEVLAVSEDGKRIDIKIMAHTYGICIGDRFCNLESKCFELVEEAKPQEVPTYYNGKIIFTKGDDIFKTGHVYEIKDGRIKNPQGDCLLPSFSGQGYTRFKSIEDVKDYFSAKSPLHHGYGWSSYDLEFIEVVND